MHRHMWLFLWHCCWAVAGIQMHVAVVRDLSRLSVLAVCKGLSAQVPETRQVGLWTAALARMMQPGNAGSQLSTTNAALQPDRSH